MQIPKKENLELLENFNIIVLITHIEVKYVFWRNIVSISRAGTIVH